MSSTPISFLPATKLMGYIIIIINIDVENKFGYDLENSYDVFDRDIHTQFPLQLQCSITTFFLQK